MKAEFVFPMRVYSEDTDSFGIVHHAQYLKYMERARLEWILSTGYRLDDWVKQGVLFVLRKASLDYLRPAHVYDELLVKSRVAKRARVSIVYEQIICLKNNPEHVFCRGEITVVCVNDKMRPRMLPEALISGRILPVSKGEA